MKLLLVDSDSEIQQWAEGNLSAEGFDVDTYSDGLSALDMFPTVDPDIILASLNLSGINILRFCNKVRQKGGDKSIPVFLLVRAGEEWDEEQLRSAGVVDFIKVPTSPQEIMAKIKPHLAARVSTPKPASPSPSRPASSSSEDQVEGLKIEELLGWSPGGDQAVEAKSLEPETAGSENLEGGDKEEDRTVIVDRAALASAGGSTTESPDAGPSGIRADQPPEAPFAEEQTVIMSAQGLASSGTSAGETVESGDRDSSSVEGTPSPSTEDSLVSGTMADLTKFSPPPEKASPSDEASSKGESPSPEAIEAAVSRVAREVIERVAWEVVPTIAEALIKEELEKLNPKEKK